MILQPPVTVQPVVVDAEHAAAAPLTAADMVVTMRERLSAVKARLGELAQLKAEEALLERMLAAAEPPPN